jgi:hypothetical protein
VRTAQGPALERIEAETRRRWLSWLANKLAH